MNDAAFVGLAGEIVEFLEPHTEADLAGLLLTFLAAFGAAVGSGPHAVADGSIHPARLNVVLVGRSARSRKGTSWAVIRRVMEQAEPSFLESRVIGGLASGEGLVADLGRRGEGLERSVLVHEPEFGRVLRVAGRSATLSALIREAWDGGDLAILTRKRPLRANGASAAILGHVTAEELRRRLDQTEIANGMANRFLFCWVERSKRLPDGGQVPQDELEVLGVRVGVAIERARQLGTLVRSPEAKARWAEIYNAIDDDVDGVVGSLCARAEAQMLRLSVVYALLDASPTIEVAHLDAAQAVWEHCEATISRVFADTEPDWVVPRLLAALQDAGPEGLDGSAQRDLFGRHLPGSRLAAARAELGARGVASTTAVDTGGRPRIITRLTQPVTVTHTVNDAVTALMAERDENSCRQEMTFSERLPLKEELEKLERPKAAAREKAGRPSPKSGEGKKDKHEGETKRKVAKALGTGATTLDKAEAVHQIANDPATAEPVREVAKQAIVNMDETGRVEPNYQAVKDAEASHADNESLGDDPHDGRLRSLSSLVQSQGDGSRS